MNPRCTRIPATETGKISRLASDYLRGDPFLSELYAVAPSGDAFRGLIEAQKSFPAQNREILVEVLKEQYQRTEIADPETIQQIDKLGLPNTFTITTGQQTGIFLGPLYTAMKILSAIALSRDLTTRFPDNHFVPVFWMATEDHDIEEINHVWINGKKHVWNTHQTGAAGRLSTSGLSEIVNELSQLAGISEDGKQLSNILHKAYSFGNLADATRYLTHALFGKYGLVVLDADDARLKQIFAPIMERDIVEQLSFKAAAAAIAKLEERYSVQVNGREINFFYLTENSRERIVKTATGFETTNQQQVWPNEDALRTEIHQQPERFSPNVMMRPVYQETILPNLAYFGGAAEVAYWLELKPGFDAHQVPYPMLLLRNSAIILDAVNTHRLHNAGLTPADLFVPSIELEKRIVLEEANSDLRLMNEKALLAELTARFEHIASEISDSMLRASRSFASRLEHQTEQFSKKLIREARKQENERLNRLRLLLESVYPGGALQERKESIIPFILNHGFRVIDDLLETQEILGNSFIVLEYSA